MTGRSSLLMCTIRLPTSLCSRCASREYRVTPFALRSGAGDGGFAPEAIPTGWVSEGMTELRRQGFFRWGWTRESAVVAARFEIERFDEDTPLETASMLFDKEVCDKNGNFLHGKQLELGFERQPLKRGGETLYYWRVSDKAG